MAYDPTCPNTSHIGEADINQIRENINQLRALEWGAADPANPVAYMLQVYTGTGQPLLRQRNAANNGWLYIYNLATGKSMLDADTLDGFHASQLGVQANSVGIYQLKTAQGYIGASEVGNHIMAGGQFSFWPQIRGSGNSGLDVQIGQGFSSGSYVTSIYAGQTMGDGSLNFELLNTYVTGSGTEYWLFLLVDRSSGHVKSVWGAPDHPCFGNGSDPDLIPHPFASYLAEPLPEGLEIILADMESTRRLQADVHPGQSISDLFSSGKWAVDLSAEAPFAPRDMDGHNTLETKHASYTVRRLIRAA